MGSDRKTTIVHSSQHRAARVAGFMFLFSLIVPLLNWTFVLSRFVVEDDVISTASNIMVNELLFRIGITIELIMAVGLVVLAVSLYMILKSVNKSLALLALCWKLVEAGVVVAIVLGLFIALLISKGAASVVVFTPEQLQVPVGLLLGQHTVLYSFPMVFLGLNMIVFFYLFLKSRYIPRILASLGIISYALILLHALGHILAPDYSTMLAVEIICYTPSCIAELAVGIWLLFKGINVSQQGCGAPC